jgi:soluble lytic murein transglycosylase
VRHDFSLRYPMPFREQFEAAAREHDIDAALLYAIARQESRFVRDIVSSAGAQGLMQLMPATARWVARQLGDNGWRSATISDVDVNTRFGAFYFRHWLERLDNHQALAAAAYNAGPNRAQAWRPGAPLDGAAWVETIPFNETRDYVKKVLANAVFYARALDRPDVSLTARLGTVTPRTGNGSGSLAAH